MTLKKAIAYSMIGQMENGHIKKNMGPFNWFLSPGIQPTTWLAKNYDQQADITGIHI